MKITMLAVGSTGDVRPFLLLGRELTHRGHQVTIASFSDFEETVVQAGLTFYPLSGSAKRFIQSIMSPESGSLTYLPRLMKEMRSVVSSLIQDMDDSCRSAEAMICNFFGSVFYSIAEKYRIPCVQVLYFSVDPNRTMPISSVNSQTLPGWMNRATYRIGYLLISMVEKHYLSSWRRENHLDLRHIRTGPDYRAGDRDALVIYALSPHVVPRPAEWGEEIHMSGFWMDENPPSWTPPEELVRFLETGEPPIYIGFGSMNSGDMSELMVMIREAVQRAGLRAVIDLGWGGEEQTPSDDLFFTRYLPHDWLFPRVRAVVHHGGAGTTAAGLRYGKPTLVIPFSGDQPFWGYHVHRLDCGPEPLPREKVTADRLTASLRELVETPSYRDSAEKLSVLLQNEHGLTTAADLIEKEITASR